MCIRDSLFGEMMGVEPEAVIVGGNSSLNMMFDTVARSMTHGVCGYSPWSRQGRVKFLCPSPGYDRHFAVCEHFGICLLYTSITAGCIRWRTLRCFSRTG